MADEPAVGGPDDGAGEGEIGGAFDSLNAIIGAVNACAGILELNLSSMGHAGTKLDEMQSHLGAVATLRRDIEQLVRMRLADAGKIRRGIERVNGDGEPDGNLTAVVSMMQLVELGGGTLVELLGDFGKGLEKLREYLSKIDTRVTEMTGSQGAAKEILDNWTIL